MITDALNLVLECATIGFFCALFLMLFAKMGWMPMVVIDYVDPASEDYE